MKQTKFLGKIFLLTGILFLSSCNKEYFQLDKLSDEMEIRPDLVAPLIHGSMVMGDLVARLDSTGFVGEFDDGLIYLSYADTLLNVRVDTLDLVLDGFYQEVYFEPEIGDNPIYISSAIGDTVHFIKSKFYSFRAEGDSRVDSIIFKGGEIVTEIESSFLHGGILTISSDYVKDENKNNYSSTIEISNPDGNFTWTEHLDLDGYFLKTDKMGDSAVFRMDYDLALINSGNPINPGDYCEINSDFLDLNYYSMYGLIDPLEFFSNSGVLDIPIYADVPELSHLKLADPRINILTENSLGVAFELELDSVIASNDDGSSVTLVLNEHPFKIPAPDLDHVGETAYGEININKQTSNFQDLLNIAPSTLSYKVEGGIDQEFPDHFILDTSRFMVEAEFMLPLDLSFSRYALRDTFEFDLGEEGIDTTVIKNVLISVSTINELPIELDLQVYMLDEFFTVVDSVFEGDSAFLPASEVDEDGKLLRASENSNGISFPTERLGSFEDIRYFLIEATLLTSGSGNQFVKFYSDYSLDFEISLYANFRINTREL
jgi:hypothetical protein